MNSYLCIIIKVRKTYIKIFICFYRNIIYTMN